MKKALKVCWISAGVSSFIAGYLAKDVDKFIYIDVENQHPDSIRFIKDCEKVLGRKIEKLQSRYKNVQNVISTFQFINGVHGAKCTEILKRRVRKEWEWEHREYDITYIWGYDCTEKHRAEKMGEIEPGFNHEFPLIDKGLTKADAHGILASLGIKRPAMYDLGYKNNNCIGCVKGGMGYWNKIRVDFPDVFQRMAALEREVGHSCINGVYLDELEPNRGRFEDEVMEECSIMCYLILTEAEE